MSVATSLAVAESVEISGTPDYHARLAALLDLKLLASLGWDPEAVIFSPAAGQSTLSWFACPHCRRESPRENQLCYACRRGGERRDERDLCRVCNTAGHERPSWRAGLCRSCEARRGQLRLSTDEYLHSAWAQPRPTFGKCRAAVCRQWAAGPLGLCHAHWTTWIHDGKPEIEQWCRWAKPLSGAQTGKLYFAGLPALVRDEVLFGIQSLHHSAHAWRLKMIRPVVNTIREQRVSRLADLRFEGDSRACREYRRFVALVHDAIRLALGDRETEVKSDVWDLRLWGLDGWLRFDGSAPLTTLRIRPIHGISQPWLREGAKQVAARHLGRDRSSCGAHKVAMACGWWSEYLERRRDCGLVPSALRKSDVTQFVVQLSLRARNGEISERYLYDITRSLRQSLQELHEEGLTDRAGPCAGLSSEVALTRHELPKPSRSMPEDEVGEALPAAAIQQLLSPEALALLPPAGQRRVRIALEVGRRPNELMRLPYECLAYDESIDPLTGAVTRLPVLVHDMPKVRRTGYRLPITQATAEYILTQQEAVRERFPNVPVSKLPLWPATQKNVHGTRSMTARHWGRELRK